MMPMIPRSLLLLLLMNSLLVASEAAVPTSPRGLPLLTQMVTVAIFGKVVSRGRGPDGIVFGAGLDHSGLGRH